MYQTAEKQQSWGGASLAKFTGGALALYVLVGLSACAELPVEDSALADVEDVQSVEEPLVPHPDCSDETQARMRKVIDATKLMLNAAVADAGRGDDHALQRWFGIGLDGPSFVFYWFQTKRTYVNWVLQMMREELNSNEVLRCGGEACSGNLGVVNYYAVRDTRIRLCNPVWSLPLVGVKSLSQTEVLAHELAHFVTEGNTTDWAYSGCVHPTYDEHKCYRYPNARTLAESTSHWYAPLNAENFAGFSAEAFVRPALAAVLSGMN